MNAGSPAGRLRAHLDTALAAGTGYAEALRGFLDEERDALRADHRTGAAGVEIVRRRTETVDAVVRHVCAHWSEQVASGRELARWALVAIGGYGRCELSPFSDLDLVFLSATEPDRPLREFNERIVHTLWDAGCEVGHAFRTVAEFIDLATTDLDTKTALLEVRCAAGDEELVATLRRRARDELFASREAAFLDQKIEERRRRHARFGATLYLQEPNIKESIGGLRDVHTILWVVQALHGTMSFERMRALGLLDRRQEKSLEHAFDFILRVRNELHFLLGRPGNVVELVHQPAIAAGLAIGGFRGASPDEHLMRLYYFHARNVSRTAALLLERLRRGMVASRDRSADEEAGEVVADGFVARDGMLEAAHARVFRDDPTRLIEVFAVAQEHELGLHPELQLLVRGSLALLGPDVRDSARAADAFLTVLGRPGRVSATLRQMHELGVLGRLVPEFGKLTCLVQHDMHHRFTIDEHTLRSIEHLDEIVRSSEPDVGMYRRMFRHLVRPEMLYLGVLLHDVGKPLGANHSASGAALARQACERLGLEAADVDRVEFLVRHHLLLPHTAFRRDLSDAKVVGDVADTVGSLDALRQLLLLVTVDIRGTAPELWNEWKQALLWDLFGRCQARLRRTARTEATKQLADAQREVQTILTGLLEPAAIRELLDQLPTRLFEIFKPGYLARLVRLPRELGDEPFAVHWSWDAERRVWNVAVCTHDRHGLLASLAGAFAVEEVNILDAYIHTLEGGIVLDVFRVAALAGRTPIDQLFIDGVNAVLDKVLRRGIAVEELLAPARLSVRRKPAASAPPEIHFSNAVSDRYTVVEVKATDRVGLLHDMLRVLSDSGLDIDSALITTDRGRVLDVFYVLDEAGRKLVSKRRQNAARERLRQALTSGAPQP